MTLVPDWGMVLHAGKPTPCGKGHSITMTSWVQCRTFQLFCWSSQTKEKLDSHRWRSSVVSSWKHCFPCWWQPSPTWWGPVCLQSCTQRKTKPEETLRHGGSSTYTTLVLTFFLKFPYFSSWLDWSFLVLADKNYPNDRNKHGKYWGGNWLKQKGSLPHSGFLHECGPRTLSIVSDSFCINVARGLQYLAVYLDEYWWMHKSNTAFNSSSNISLGSPFPKSCCSAFLSFAVGDISFNSSKEPTNPFYSRFPQWLRIREVFHATIFTGFHQA